MGFSLILSGSALAEFTKNGTPVGTALSTTTTTSTAPPQAQAQGAALVVLVKPGATANAPIIVRHKNVSSVTSPSTGIYCVKATYSAFINPTLIVSTVTVDWGLSLGSSSDALFAYAISDAGDCPTGTIEVQTYDNNGGKPALSSAVAFTLVVN